MVKRPPGGEGTWAPPVDIYETDDTFVLKAELPGFSKADLQIELHDNRLTLRGERKRETEPKEEQYHRIERAYGRFERAFWLPSSPAEPGQPSATRERVRWPKVFELLLAAIGVTLVRHGVELALQEAQRGLPRVWG
jgi:hypothetical protein